MQDPEKKSSQLTCLSLECLDNSSNYSLMGRVPLFSPCLIRWVELALAVFLLLGKNKK